MKPQNHYERAFEAYLQQFHVLCLATRERCRALVSEKEYASLKTPDFLITRDGQSWLVDIKGRRFPSGVKHKQYWRNWISQDDLVSMIRWESYFGVGFRGIFVFAYEIVQDKAPLPQERLFSFQERLYAFVAVPAETYQAYKKPLSPAWKTITMSAADFKARAVPLDELLGLGKPPANG